MMSDIMQKNISLKIGDGVKLKGTLMQIWKCPHMFVLI